MTIVKLSAFPTAGSVLGTDELGLNEAGTTKKATATQIRTYVGTGLNNAAITATSGAYATDTYLAGSAITIPTAGAWVAGSFYRCGFDMTKTAAGTATLIITVRMGTLGTTGDAAITTMTWGAGTAVADSGWFEVVCTFRAVGGGTTALLKATGRLNHGLAATGLTTSGASGFSLQGNLSAGFNSTTQTIIGISVNGGASFSGGVETVIATLDKYQ